MTSRMNLRVNPDKEVLRQPSCIYLLVVAKSDPTPTLFRGLAKWIESSATQERSFRDWDWGIKRAQIGQRRRTS